MKTFLLLASLLLIGTAHNSCSITISSESTLSDLEPLLTIDGYWKFNIGDDQSWAAEAFDDSKWDSIVAPGSWQDWGYIGYNSYAWYRKEVQIPSTRASDFIYISLGRIDDVNELYFNGVMIGQMGSFPPDFQTAYDHQVVYPIPKSLIRFNTDNMLAVRVYDNEGEGGIVSGPLMIGYYHNEALLSQNLSGKWRIKFDFNRRYTDYAYDDSKWDEIFVPATWESQGFNDYDGTASYRKSFVPSFQSGSEDLYLILGKIDDKDRVYLNGKLIGRTEDMYRTPLGNRFNGDWQIRRAYKIPSGLLKYDQANILVVMVEDLGMNGGIFEGPVGIMTKENYKEYVEEYRFSSSPPFVRPFRID